MRYSIGDKVEFKNGPIETNKGEVEFVEEDCNERTLYVNSYSGVSLCELNYRHPFPGRPITEEKDCGKESNDSFSLGSREERVSLLKDGFSGKDIESEYLRLNRIMVIRVDWQDLNSK